MSQKNVYIISLKFAPGLYKEFHLIGDKLEEKGFSVSYILSEGYREATSSEPVVVDFLSTSRNMKEVLFDCIWFFLKGSRLFKKKLKYKRPQGIYFYNMHPLNIMLARLTRIYFPNTILLFHLHEPFQPDKSFFSLSQRIIIQAQEYLQAKLVNLCDHIVVPSSFAKHLFHKYFPRYNGQVHFVPLCIPDKPVKSSSRSYLLMSGRIFSDGRMKDFLHLVEYAASVGVDFRFRIVTSSFTGNFLQGKLSTRAKSLVDIIEKRPLSDEEINGYMANAFACICMHTRGAQSGVTPVAFMNSTPIVARNIPMFSQYIKDGVNGRLIVPTAKPSEWLFAIQYVKENFKEMNREARKTYVSIFHEKNLEKYLEWFFEEIARAHENKP